MAIFQRGVFQFSSGRMSDWKVEIDNATDEDIETLCRRGIVGMGGFSEVISVPKGKSGSPIDNAERMAAVLRPFASPARSLPALIVDDVLTTGNSMEEMKWTVWGLGMPRLPIGLVLFSHIVPPPWIKAVWILG